MKTQITSSICHQGGAKMNINRLLQCPGCGSSIISNEDVFECTSCYRRFRKRMGVLDFLLSREDQWMLVGKGFMNGQEELERRFFEPSEDELSPADRLIKAIALWYRGEFDDFQRLLRPFGQEPNRHRSRKFLA